jgi:hypothetical protein
MIKWILVLAMLLSLAMTVVTTVQLRSDREAFEQARTDDSSQQPASEELRRQRIEQGQFWHRLSPTLWAITAGFFLLVLVLWTIIKRKRRRATRLEVASSLGSK